MNNCRGGQSRPQPKSGVASNAAQKALIDFKKIMWKRTDSLRHVVAVEERKRGSHVHICVCEH